jgi:hypothetical protein
MKSPLLAAALACVSLRRLADESDVRKAVEAKLGKVEKIVKAPMAGIWEVTVDGQIFYADDKANYLLFGNLLDMKTGKNLTAERQFNSLPLRSGAEAGARQRKERAWSPSRTRTAAIARSWQRKSSR